MPRAAHSGCGRACRFSVLRIQSGLDVSSASPQPGRQLIFAEAARRQGHPGEIERGGLGFEGLAVEQQERTAGDKGYALVAVHEGMTGADAVGVGRGQGCEVASGS